MRSIERPTANVRDVSLSSASFAGVSGELALDITNPNGFGVPLSGIDWELSITCLAPTRCINHARALTGSVQLSQTIPARGVAPVKTALTIATRDAIAAASALAGGARDYQLVAHLHFSTPVGPLAVEVTHAGTLGAGAVGVR
ncbi:MAG: LEA type 2 family protein [Deltaproteobacteria bacterium]|nr:LEA type 2 family protein [Deltaproteobacteria bacterium]